jgi:hypothetical protein
MPGAASAGRGSEPVSQGGGIALRLDGSPIGVPRDTVNLLTSPGITPTVTDDPTPGSEKADVGFDLSAVVLLVAPITGADLVAGVGTLNLIPALAGATRLIVDRVQIVPETVDGAPGVQPIIQVETPAGVGDHVASGALLVTGDNLQDLPMVTPRPILDSVGANNLLNLVQTGLATATNYTVTVLVWGYVLTP